MKCQAVCLALGYDGKEATVPNFKELTEGEAMSFNPQSHHKTEQTYGQVSQCPSNLWILSRWRGQRTSWLYCVKNTCRKSLLVQEPKIPETALFQQKLYTQGPLQPSPALRFPRSRRAGRHQSETHVSLSALRGSGQRSSKHLGERMELAVWDVPAVPTLQRPVEGLEK